MALIALVLTVLSNSPNYEFATLSRFYYPGKRKSYFAPYLVTRDGRTVRLSRSSRTSGPVWTDRTHVAWVDHGSGKDDLWVATLPGLSKKRLLTAKSIRTASSTEAMFEIDGRWLRLRGNRFEPSSEPKAPESELRVSGDGLSITYKEATFQIDNHEVEWRQSSTVDGKQEFSIESLASNSSFEVGSVSAGKYTFLAAAFSFTAHDVACLLLRVDPSSMTAHLFPIDAEWIRMDGKRRRFFALSGRSIATFDGYGLWGSDCYFGELPSGTHHKIPLPFGYTIWMTARP